MRLLFLLILHLGVTAYGFGQTPKVYVFLPSNIRAKAMEQVLGGACPKLDITVFGRLRGFTSEVKANPPDAILVVEPLIDRYKDYKPMLLGSKDGDVKEFYALLSVSEKVDLSKIGEIEIGALNLLGRRHMSGFVKRMVGGSLRTKTVAKYEDLLSLLQFQDAGAILVPKSKIPYYTSKSRLKLITTEIPDAKVGLAVLAVKTDDPAVRALIMSSFTALQEVVNDKLGVDTWVAPPE